MLIVGAGLLIFAAVGVNIIANFVAPAFDNANVCPRHISFRGGGVIALVSLPWKMYSTPVVINYFLGGLGALIGPLFGIMIVDNYLIKRQIVRINELYRPNVRSPYFFRNGVNPRAVAAFVPAAVLSVVVATVPALSEAGTLRLVHRNCRCSAPPFRRDAQRPTEPAMTEHSRYEGPALTRDFRGYGRRPPVVRWPGGARVAVSLVVNYEAGSENSLPRGDQFQEPIGEFALAVNPFGGQVRDLPTESTFEYESRAGVWRVARALDEFDVKATFFACGMALEEKRDPIARCMLNARVTARFGALRIQAREAPRR